MWLEKIYDMVYTEQEEKIDKQDAALIEKLDILLTGVKEETISRDTAENLIGEAALIGEKQGFINGIHFFADLILEVLQ